MWKKKTRQKVKKYIGAVTRLESVENHVPDIRPGKARDVLLEIIRCELAKTGFVENGNRLEREDIFFTNMKLRKGKRKAVLALNDGYLCDYTLRQILTFRRSEDIKKDSIELARSFVDAGLNVPKEVFIHFFKSLR